VLRPRGSGSGCEYPKGVEARVCPRFGPIIAKLVNLNSTFRRRPAMADDAVDYSGTSDSDSDSESGRQ
jgi:hypothetical protein